MVFDADRVPYVSVELLNKWRSGYSHGNFLDRTYLIVILIAYNSQRVNLILVGSPRFLLHPPVFAGCTSISPMLSSKIHTLERTNTNWVILDWKWERKRHRGTLGTCFSRSVITDQIDRMHCNKTRSCGREAPRS